MDLYLTTINHNEIFKGNGTIILSSLGRIYVLPNYMNNIYFEHNYSEFLLNINNLKTISSKQFEDFHDYGKKYGNIIYEYNNISVNTSKLVSYLKVSDSFMAFLINNNMNTSFENIVQNFKSRLFRLSVNDIHSLLKPVYIRYMMAKRNPQNLIRIRENINNYSNSWNIKKVTLYDVPCIIKNSELRLLDNLWIDLTESVEVKTQNSLYFTYQNYKCLSLGSIKKFDKVEIELFRERDPNSINFYNKIGIKKITLNGRGYY